MTKKVAYALDYAKRGWPVLPLHYVTSKGKCSCGKAEGECKPGKHPLATAIFKEGYKSATLDAEVIKKTWNQYPEANIGWVLGKIIVVDQDNRHGGEEALAKLEAKYGPLPRTVAVLTGSGDGSKHRYYLPPNSGVAVDSLNRIDGLPGLELKTKGYVVGVGSITKELYVWELGASPDDIALASLPDWLVELSKQPFKPTEPQKDKPKKDYPELTTAQNEKALTKVLGSCAFVKHCGKDATTLSEPEWQALIELLVFFGEPGIAKIHELSSPYPTYSEAETDTKIANATKAIDKKGLGPYTCGKIQQGLGFGCPLDCPATARSPVPWAVKTLTGGRPLPHTPIDESREVQQRLHGNTKKVQQGLQEGYKMEGKMEAEVATGGGTRGVRRQAWVKVYITGWLHGSVRWDLKPEERSVWTDLICLAGECGKGGKICDNDGKPYPLGYIAHVFNVSEKLLLRTIEKCKAQERLTDDDGVLCLTNWKVYQSEYERQKAYRDKLGVGN